MRCELAVVLAGCAYTSLDEPIGVVSRDLSDEDAANLAESAACWNLEFGTSYVTGDAARVVPQQVQGFYDEQTCLSTVAQTQVGMPSSIAVCPERYWAGIEPGVYGAQITPFRVLSHELGHELNIVGHPDAPFAVMLGGGLDFTAMFAAADHQMFDGANPDWTGTSPCREVIRSIRPFTRGAIGHCACDTGPLDVTRRITLVLPPDDTADAPALADAAQCWSLRYGLDVVAGADDGGQAVDLDRGCGLGVRVQDGPRALVCARLGYTDVFGPMRDVADALGTDYEGTPDGRFDPDDDATLADTYPGVHVACTRLVRDPGGACTCRDGLRTDSGYSGR